jgi:hypothetical protein
MTLVLAPLPIFTAGQAAPVQLDVQTEAPVHAVSIEFVGDGKPAFYFVGSQDLRGLHTYLLIPMRAGSYLVTVEATDEQGCHAQLLSGAATVR